MKQDDFEPETGKGFVCEMKGCRKPATWVVKNHDREENTEEWLCDECYNALGKQSNFEPETRKTFFCEELGCDEPAKWVRTARGKNIPHPHWLCDKHYLALGVAPGLLELKEVLPKPTALSEGLPEDGSAERRLYHLSRPIHPARGSKCHECGHECEANVRYIVVSAVKRPWLTETMIFEGDAEGNVVSWLDYPGTVKGDMNFDLAIAKFLEHFNG